MPIHVDGREEDGLHLVVPQLVGREVGSDQHLGEKQGRVSRVPTTTTTQASQGESARMTGNPWPDLPSP